MLKVNFDVFLPDIENVDWIRLALDLCWILCDHGNEHLGSLKVENLPTSCMSVSFESCSVESVVCPL